jgi:hypothetical protein
VKNTSTPLARPYPLRGLPRNAPLFG